MDWDLWQGALIGIISLAVAASVILAAGAVLAFMI